MPRSLLALALISHALTPALAQRPVGCMNPQAQLQIQIYWMRQMEVQRQQTQMRALQMTTRNVAPVRAPAQVYRTMTPIARPVALANTRTIATRTVSYAPPRITQTSGRAVLTSTRAIGGTRPIAPLRTVAWSQRTVQGPQRTVSTSTRTVSTTQRAIATNTRPVTTTTRRVGGPTREVKFNTREVSRTRAQLTEKHTPIVMMKITMTGSCGSCHRNGNPGLSPNRPGPLPALVRPVPVPRLNPVPPLGPALVRPLPNPKPAPVPALAPLPRPGAMPGLVPVPLARVVPPPGLAQPKKAEPKTPSIGEQIALTPKKTSEPPPPVPAKLPDDVPLLKVGLLLSVEEGFTKAARATPPPPLMPSLLAEAPSVAPLEGSRVKLLPNLFEQEAYEREEVEVVGGPALTVELVSQPPEVAPLPDPIIR
jgi:hypothetical protein